MDIMTNYQGYELDNALIALDELLIKVDRFINHAPLDSDKFSIEASDHIFEGVLRIYDRILNLCYDKSYIIEERDTLLDALEQLNPLQFQNLFILCMKFWKDATYLPLDPLMK